MYPKKIRTMLSGLSLAMMLLLCGTRADAVEPPVMSADPHVNAMGFFDIHVCNWPDQPLFFLALFSTTHYKGVRAVEIFDPNGRRIGKLDLEKFRIIAPTGNRPEKHVFMRHLVIPPDAGNGWYSARTTMDNGKTYSAKDYVVLAKMPRATGFEPADGANDIPPPKTLRWKAIPGAKDYQVFIRDMWDGDRLIYTSKLIGRPELTLPAGLLQAGGYYQWRIHARNINGDVLFGDFNQGSLTRELSFTVRGD